MLFDLFFSVGSPIGRKQLIFGYIVSSVLMFIPFIPILLLKAFVREAGFGITFSFLLFFLIVGVAILSLKISYCLIYKRLLDIFNLSQVNVWLVVGLVIAGFFSWPLILIVLAIIPGELYFQAHPCVFR